MAQFLPNPEENWGPKRRAGRQPLSDVTQKETAETHDSEGNQMDEEDK